MAKITYYDFSYFYYTSFFVQGFREIAKERGHEFAVSYQYPVEFKKIGLKPEWLLDFGDRGSVFRYEDGNNSSLFFIDASNINGLYLDSAIAQPLLEICDHYFKVSYHEEAIAADPTAVSHADKIKPVDNVWPVAPPQKWRYLPRLSAVGSSWSVPMIKRRLRWLRTYPTLDDYRTLRQVDNDIDVFFVTTYRRDDVHGGQNQQRLIVMEELSKYEDINLVTGFASRVRDIPGDFAKYRMPYIDYDDYLNMLARSRIGLYVRGTYGCLSTKFGEQMALGKAIVGETLLNNTENMYAFNNFDEQFAYDDPYEMVDRIRYLLSKPDKLKELEEINTDTFERHLVPKLVTAGLLDQVEAGL